jgi:uncharacterized membrane protein YphA (DoxX/SURF4 family)
MMIGSANGSDGQRWISTMARVVLGATLSYAGIVKLLEPGEALQAVQAYRILPASLDDVVAIGLPLLELIVGVLLLLGLGTRLAAWVAAGLMVIFIAGIASAWIRGLSIDCGCFGGGGDVAPASKAWRYTSEILRDLALALVAGWLIWFPGSRWSMDLLVDQEDVTDEPGGDDRKQNAEHEESPI